MKRLADIAIDTDGEEFVFRVRPGDQLKAAIARFLSFGVDRQHLVDVAGVAPIGTGPIKVSLPTPAEPPNRGASGKPTLRAFDAATDKLIAADYRAGLSIPDLVKKYGGRQPSIGNALDRENVERRSTAEALRLAWARRKGDVSTEPPVSSAKSAPPVHSSGQSDNQTPAPAADRTASRNPAEPKPVKPSSPPARQIADARAERPAPKATGSRAQSDNAEKSDRNAEIERLYVVEELSSGTIAAMFDISPARIREVLETRGVKMRTRAEAYQLMARQKLEHAGGVPLAPKPKPLQIPADAPVKIVLPEPIAPPPPKEKGPKTAGRDAIKEKNTRHIRGRTKINMSPAEQQAAINEHFAKGGVITKIEQRPVPSPGGYRANVGFKDGRK